MKHIDIIKQLQAILSDNPRQRVEKARESRVDNTPTQSVSAGSHQALFPKGGPCFWAFLIPVQYNKVEGDKAGRQGTVVPGGKTQLTNHLLHTLLNNLHHDMGTTCGYPEGVVQGEMVIFPSCCHKLFPDRRCIRFAWKNLQCT